MLVFLLVVALLEAVGRNDVAVVEPEGEGKMPEERLGPVVVDMIAVAEAVVDSAVVGPGLGTRYRLAVLICSQSRCSIPSACPEDRGVGVE
jgi:hypothetical protein